MDNSEVRPGSLGRDGKSFNAGSSFHRLRCLEHVLCMPNHHLDTVFGEVAVGWKNFRGGQIKT